MEKKEPSFILYANCRIVKGAKRSMLVDYVRNIAYYISNDYANFIQEIDHKTLSEIKSQLDDEQSIRNFEHFLELMQTHNLAFVTSTPNCFPYISKELNDENVLIKNTIIEIDEETFNSSSFSILCSELSVLKCKDIQIRLLSALNIDFLNNIFKNMGNTEAAYIELHATYDKRDDLIVGLRRLIEQCAVLSNVYLYGAEQVGKEEVVNKIEGYFPMALGNIYYLDYPFDSGCCCGQICLENLDFTGPETNNLLMQKNGCLYKKISIDTEGNIHNCPSMKQTYGNVKNTRLVDVLRNKDFIKWWNISKDTIKVCCDCEFRYNCTDCRAFLLDPADPYSKPFKCSYNPYTCEWQ